jgi:hypothetical protein
MFANSCIQYVSFLCSASKFLLCKKPANCIHKTKYIRRCMQTAHRGTSKSGFFSSVKKSNSSVKKVAQVWKKVPFFTLKLLFFTLELIFFNAAPSSVKKSNSSVKKSNFSVKKSLFFTLAIMKKSIWQRKLSTSDNVWKQLHPICRFSVFCIPIFTL